MKTSKVKEGEKITLYELVTNYNNLIELHNNKDISETLLKPSLKAIREDIIDKVINILEYRKNLLEEGKTAKLEELDEYVYYCLYLARIEKVEFEDLIIEIPKTTNKIIIKEKIGNEN